VGPSGSGKSTIVQLIERFYDPEKGAILIDGEDIKSLNLKSLRQTLGYVGQEPVLFNTSIKENILFGKSDATDEEIKDALQNSNAWQFIEKKMGSQGINTSVGSAGGKLSGGQKQRIAIARAFIKQPKILLLDEATSALDKKNEQIVQQAIDRIKEKLGSITTIVIAHRLSTIKEADNILVLKYGELKEEGSHASLLQQYPDGIYANFVKQQEAAEK
jgi:ATP-binding cassette subfamily B (MDR/TAP) protein 1